MAVAEYTLEQAAARAGLEPARLERLVELGIVAPQPRGRFTAGDVRRAMLVGALEDGGISLDGLAAAVRRGALSFEFLDAKAYERLATLTPETFRQVSERTGIPLDLVMLIREAIGMALPSPDDRVREDELVIVPFLKMQVDLGFRPVAIERLLRVMGESTRRITDQEGAWWYSEVIAPAIAAGKGTEEIANSALADVSTPLAERTVLAMYHAHQAQAWTANIVASVEVLLARAGLHSRLDRPPAICFLDITGYTRLTQERGDDAAADLAGTVGRLVERSSVAHGGKPIKWLGDGVMFHFRDPGPAVRAALEMVEGLAAAGLPPAHVGLDAGPVLYQAGDYFGQTVNVAARIADYARPREVLVSQAVVDAVHEAGIAFQEIGPVELKGVAGTIHLQRAQRA